MRLVMGTAAAAAVATSLGLGVVLASAGIAQRSTGTTGTVELCFMLLGVLALWFVRRNPAEDGRVPSGSALVAAALAFGLLIGVRGSNPAVADQRAKLAFLFFLGIASFVVGTVLASLLLPRTSVRAVGAAQIDPLQVRSFRFITLGALGLAFLNFATGTIPLLAANVDAVRFSGSGGAFGRFWIWIIGVVEWGTVVVAVRALLVRALPLRAATFGLVGLAVLALLASRSFFLIIALSVVVAYSLVSRLSVTRMVLLAVGGVFVLGLLGASRIGHSDPTGARRAYLQSQHMDNVYGLITQSAASGPAAFAQTLKLIPTGVPFQHGGFLMRDFRALLPLHPLGKPERSDIWVTDAILHRDPSEIGGSPPTLVGGLYIDFGLPGIVVGAALIGFLLVALHRWASRQGTLGALVAYAYVAAYVALSAYSYVSVKPTVIAVLACSYLLHRAEHREHTTAHGADQAVHGAVSAWSR